MSVKNKIYLILILCCIQLVHADNICQVQGGGILDNLVIQFGNAAAGWQTQINPLAKKLFFILFGMEFMWQLAVKKVFAGDVEKLWVFFFTRTVLCFFFAKYVVNVALYQDVIVYVSKLGSQLGGFMLNISPSQNFTTLGPSEIVGQFSCVADAIHTMSDSTGTFQYITLKLTLAIMQVVLLVVLVFIAYGLMKVILQGYFLLYVGFLLTGFAGSSWTMDYWKRYVQAISGVAIKFLTVCVIMGVLTVQMKDWASAINAANAANSMDMLATVLLKVLATSILIALIANHLPEWAASSLAGGVNMQLAEGIASVSRVMSGGGGNSSSQRASRQHSATLQSATLHSGSPKSNDLSSAPMASRNDLSKPQSLSQQNSQSFGTNGGSGGGGSGASPVPSKSIFQAIVESRKK